MAHDCPKCKSKSAWFKVTEYDVVLRCLCGLYRIVATSLNTASEEDDETEHEYEELKLPKRDTNLWVTLLVLASLEVATSAEIKDRLIQFGKESFTTSDVSSYLTILRSKGLVRTIEIRRGTLGGSTWMLTDRAIFLLGV